MRAHLNTSNVKFRNDKAKIAGSERVAWRKVNGGGYFHLDCERAQAIGKRFCFEFDTVVNIACIHIFDLERVERLARRWIRNACDRPFKQPYCVVKRNTLS